MFGFLRSRFLSLALLLLVLPGAPLLADYPLELDSTKRPLLNGRISAVNDILLKFRFDSGASQSVLYETAAFQLLLSNTPYETRRVFTGNGYKEYPLVRVKGFEALGLIYDVERTVTLPDPVEKSAVGLLGVDMFQGQIVYLDPGSGRADTLTQAELNKLGLMEVRGRPVAKGSLAIKIDVGGVDIPALVDTGATNTVMNGPAKRLIERHLGDGLKRMDGGLRLVIGPITVKSADNYSISKLRIGAQTVTDFRILQADLPIFTTLGAKNAPAIIMGMDLLGDRAMAFDFKRYRLYLGPPSRAD